jgi:hypothetical protein
MISRVRGRLLVNFDQANYLLACYGDDGVVTTFSSFRSSDRKPVHLKFSHLRVFQRERCTGVPMPFQAILREVDQLQNVSTRLEALADQHPLVSEPLTTIALSVRNTATLLEVLVATKGPKPI